MKEDRLEVKEQVINQNPQKVRPEFPEVKTGIKAGPDIGNQPQP